MAVDWDDPCARYAALRDAYNQALIGGIETLIFNKGPNGEQEVRFSPTSLNDLRVAMMSAQAECSASTGAPNPNRRFAIRLGAQRRRFPGQF